MNTDALNYEEITIKIYDAIENLLDSKSKNTKTAYQSILRDWCAFLGTTYGGKFAAFRLGRAKYKTAVAYYAHLKKQPITDRTVGRKLLILRSIYKHLKACELIAQNPFDRLIIREGDSRPTVRPHKQITVEGLRKLWQLFEGGQEPECVRNRAIIAILMGGGLRSAEVRKLKISSVLYDGDYLALRIEKSKNSKVQDQVIPKQFHKRILELKAQRLRDGASSLDPLIISYRRNKGSRRPIDNKTFYLWVTSWFERCGLREHSPHDYRHTYATALLRQGLDHREVQEALRVSSVIVVEKYDRREYALERAPGLKLKLGIE